MVISAKNIVHSAFYLATTLLCVAVYFIMLRAQYLAAVQILVYMGAVVVLILFALMFFARQGNGKLHIHRKIIIAVIMCANTPPYVIIKTPTCC